MIIRPIVPELTWDVNYTGTLVSQYLKIIIIIIINNTLSTVPNTNSIKHQSAVTTD